MANIVVKFEGRWVQLASRGLDRDGLKRLVRRLGLSFHVDETDDDDTPRCPTCRAPVLGARKWSVDFNTLCLDCGMGFYEDGEGRRFVIVEEK